MKRADACHCKLIYVLRIEQSRLGLLSQEDGMSQLEQELTAEHQLFAE